MAEETNFVDLGDHAIHMAYIRMTRHANVGDPPMCSICLVRDCPDFREGRAAYRRGTGLLLSHHDPVTPTATPDFRGAGEGSPPGRALEPLQDT